MCAANSKLSEISPIIKWAGGKKKLTPLIEQAISKKFNLDKIDTYIEPFAGGASLFLHLATKYQFKKQVIMDINPELINLYIQVRDHLQPLMTGLTNIQIEYNTLSNDDDFDEKKNYFYQVRNCFNQTLLLEQSKSTEIDTTQKIEQAVRFIFLNKTDFNGLYRVNSKGTFNVPFGRRKQLNLFDNDNLLNFSNLLQNTEILLGDYQDTLHFADENSFFYFDPPYRPLSDSASFTSYAKSSFNDASQIELANFIKEITKRRSHFALSNSDPHQSDPNDDFFDSLYSDYTIQRIQAARMISARSKGRGNVSELLIIN
ncbi:DNA adenine methylase [Levilactobacillus enshiensis]|uniref:DNA adenine methylase n=1 Tax=Levilactobacillus enshiensis TaxID=2590213 RepID=UPI001179A6CC|nr:DNA adenine methylase [Levilactobacillus enshiensis]